MTCPLCIDQQLEITHRAGIEIDICPKCRGIWLDRGELDRLAASVPAEPALVAPAPASSQRPDSRYRDDDGTRQSKPEKPKKQKKPKKSKKRQLADRLGDVLEEVLDL